ncbi:MAG: 3'(2'),5'-bisphosphate nucleotidase CysQ [Sedimentisphaerales bacterium]|jgi:myo-inositol-1(or 4)-monophosphatase
MLESELKVVKHAVRKAGEAILSIGDEYYKQAAKHVDRTVVTKADIGANQIIQNCLRKEFPDYGWLSEETKDDKSRLNKDRVWIVDPMDGTREFVMKVPEFVVSVALAEKGQIVLGVLYNPCTEELYEAVRAEGTKLNGRQVYCTHVLDGKPKVEVSRSDIQKNLFAEYDNYLELRPCGSIAYKLARLATGQADGTLSITPKNEWDIAGGVLLVSEACGWVTDLSGKQYRFNQVDSLVNGVIAASTEAYAVIKSSIDRDRA